MELYKLTVHEARQLLKERQITVDDLVRAVTQRIEQTENSIDSFITLDIENAMLQAKTMNTMMHERAELSSLAGIPMALQDNICTFDLKTTASSRTLKNFVPPYDATIVEILRQHQSIIMGKLNMDEFGIGSSTQKSATKPTKNPWNIERVPGGAAGGAGAAVAADQIFYAIGSDAAGCLRQPAAFCGVVGFKPTYGLVSRYGLIACASSLEQIGCIAKDVTDCAYILDAIISYDKKDPRSIKGKNVALGGALVEHIKGLKIGMPKEIFDDSWDPSVRSSIASALAVFEELGAELVEISLPHAKYVPAAHFILLSCEGASNLARYDGIKYGFRADSSKDLDGIYLETRSQGFGYGIKSRIMLGNLLLTSQYYDSHFRKAQVIRRLIREDFKKAYEECHVVLTPTSPVLAFDHDIGLSQPIGMNESQRYTIFANMTGAPAISIPCGFSDEGLPIGIQLMGDLFSEETLIRAAYTFERNTDFHLKKPMLPEVVK